MPMFRRAARSSFGFKRVRSAPATVTLPLSGRSSRFMHLTSVLFPAPERPIIPKISPCPMSRQTSLSAVTRDSPEPKAFVRPRISISAMYSPLWQKIKPLTHRYASGAQLQKRVTTLLHPRLAAAGLMRYHHTPAAVTGAPVADSLAARPRDSGTMFTRLPRAPFPLSEAHCAVPSGLLFPSLSLCCGSCAFSITQPPRQSQGGILNKYPAPSPQNFCACTNSPPLRAGCRDERPCDPFLRDFFCLRQKKPLRLQRKALLVLVDT